MADTPNIPVIFTAFANPKGDLPNLTREQNGIQDVLTPLEAEGRVKHLLRTDTDLSAYFDFLKKWEDQIVVFHFAGHASSEVISFQNADIFFKPLAEELLIRNKESLKLVFLNGCSTWSHMKILFDLGVPAVIATSAKIEDNEATQFSVRFYNNIAQGDDLELAYRSAANYIKGNSTEKRFQNLGEVQKWRSTGFDQSEEASIFPWGLYVAPSQDLSKELLIGPPISQSNAIPGLQKKCLWIWQGFTAIATLIILAQTIKGALAEITTVSWAWLLAHYFPGLIILYTVVFSKRNKTNLISKGNYRLVLWFTVLYMFIALGTLFFEPFLSAQTSLKTHLLTSFLWLQPFNILIIWMYYKVFLRR